VVKFLQSESAAGLALQRTTRSLVLIDAHDVTQSLAQAGAHNCLIMDSN